LLQLTVQCCSSLLKQDRLECNSNMQFLWETKNSERVILFLNCDTSIEPVTLNSCLGEQQSPRNLARQSVANARGYSQEQTWTTAVRCHPSARHCKAGDTLSSRHVSSRDVTSAVGIFLAHTHTSVTLLMSRDLTWSSGRLTCRHAS
jgi:hypothetical protein